LVDHLIELEPSDVHFTLMPNLQSCTCTVHLYVKFKLRSRVWIYILTIYLCSCSIGWCRVGARARILRAI
jgi:hypothetical protein